MKEFIILGNGFDLSCNLSSSYKDFFKRRLDSLFNTTDTDEIINLLNNVSAESSYKREKNNNQSAAMKEFKEQQRENESTVSKFTSRKYVIKKPKTIEPGEEDRQFEFLEVQAKYPDITRWDLFFIYAKKYLKDETNEWQDVENIIDNVITIALHDKIRKNVLSMPSSQYVTNLHFKPDGEEKFKLAIYKYSCVNFDETDVNERAYSLLISLNQFEEVFSKYICLQMDIEHSKNLNSPYFQCAKELLKNITEMKLGDRPEINVWSFNYTLGPRFQDKLKDDGWDLHTWNNIHGMACHNDPDAKSAIKHTGEIPAPILGVNPNDILSLPNYKIPERVIFIKPYRLINNKFRNARQEFSFKNIDKIIIYGHSLGEADYSYFEYIFDAIDIYSKDVELVFYYWPGELSIDEIKQRIPKDVFDKVKQQISGNSPEEIKRKIIEFFTDKIEQKNMERKYTEKVVKMLNRYGANSDFAKDDIVTKLAVQGRLSILPNSKISI